MAVAKSYENMTISGEPFSQDGKMYVKVIGPCSRCGGTGNYSYNQVYGTTCFKCNGSGKNALVVRWYTDAQRATMDKAAEKRAAIKKDKVEERRIKFSARNAFGFGDAGYITIFKGNNDILNNWAHETNPCRARFNLLFGWFCPSTLEIVNLPSEVTPIVLNWDMVRDPNDAKNLTMRSDDEVRKIIRNLIGENSTSTYQGEVGDWIERKVTIKKNIATESKYGKSRIHIMEDEDGNVYVWITASKSIAVDTTCLMRMKVKEHKEYEDVQQTVVYYCKVKE